MPLPVATTSFVGRGAEVDDVLARLRRDDVRLVTLRGPGRHRQDTSRARGGRPAGRRASRRRRLRAARGDRAIRLTSGPRPSSARSACATRARSPPIEVVRAHLADRALLLVVDNFEHLLDAAEAGRRGARVRPPVSRCWRRAASRSGCGPSTRCSCRRCPTTMQSASSSIGRDHDGTISNPRSSRTSNPSATSSTACRSRSSWRQLAPGCCAPREILDRLCRQLDFLVAGPRDVPARQQALRSTIEWSYDLLDPEQQRAFAALGTFAGSFTRVAPPRT